MKNKEKNLHAAPPMDISTRIVNAKQMCHSANQHVTEICIVKDMQRGIMANATQRLHLNVQVLKVVGNTIRGTLERWTWMLDVDQEGGEIDIMDAISKKEVICLFLSIVPIKIFNDCNSDINIKYNVLLQILPSFMTQWEPEKHVITNQFIHGMDVMDFLLARQRNAKNDVLSMITLLDAQQVTFASTCYGTRLEGSAISPPMSATSFLQRAVVTLAAAHATTLDV